MALTDQLGVPARLLTPGSLRPGGVVRDFAEGRANLMEIMFHGRWESVKSLTRYLQAGLAAHAVLNLPPGCRARCSCLCALLPQLFAAEV